jgi:hypothetical protein
MDQVRDGWWAIADAGMNLSDFIQCEKFVDQQRSYCLLKMTLLPTVIDSALWEYSNCTQQITAEFLIPFRTCSEALVRKKIMKSVL